MGEVLVIGYGNELRGDDGLGPHIAAAIVVQGRPGVRVVKLHQLTPELAEDLAGARRAIFVDARVEDGTEAVEVRRLTPGGEGSLGHVSDPRLLLALAQAVYGQAPEAWLVAVAGRDFGPGRELSDFARANAAAAVRWVEQLVEGRQPPRW